MKSTVKRALWAFTLKATVLRHPRPPAPALAPESEHEPVTGGVDLATGDDMTSIALGTVPAGTLKPGVPLRLQDMVDAYIAATSDEPGELDCLKAFQRFYLGDPFAAGGEHRGGVRLVGERGPEREISWDKSPFLHPSERVALWPRCPGKSTVLRTLATIRGREITGVIRDEFTGVIVDELEGSSCD